MPGAALVLALALAHPKPPPPPRAMVIAPAPNVETMIIRRNADGTVDTACVDNDDAARAFLAGAKTKSVKK